MWKKNVLSLRNKEIIKVKPLESSVGVFCCSEEHAGEKDAIYVEKLKRY